MLRSVPSNMASSSGQADSKKQSDEGFLLYGGLFASQACPEDFERQTLPPEFVQNQQHARAVVKCQDFPQQYTSLTGRAYNVVRCTRPETQGLTHIQQTLYIVWAIQL